MQFSLCLSVAARPRTHLLPNRSPCALVCVLHIRELQPTLSVALAHHYGLSTAKNATAYGIPPTIMSPNHRDLNLLLRPNIAEGPSVRPEDQSSELVSPMVTFKFAI